jgi:hypothetical protein
LVFCLALAIRAQQREAAGPSDQHAVEHLLGLQIGRILALLFDLAVVAAFIIAYFGLVFLVWKVIKTVYAYF